MKKYTYLPPKVKHSTKLVNVIDEAGKKKLQKYINKNDNLCMGY